MKNYGDPIIWDCPFSTGVGAVPPLCFSIGDGGSDGASGADRRADAELRPPIGDSQIIEYAKRKIEFVLIRCSKPLSFGSLGFFFPGDGPLRPPNTDRAADHRQKQGQIDRRKNPVKKRIVPVWIGLGIGLPGAGFRADVGLFAERLLTARPAQRLAARLAKDDSHLVWMTKTIHSAVTGSADANAEPF